MNNATERFDVRRHRVVAALSAALLIGACGSGATPTFGGTSATVLIPSPPDITDARVVDGAMVISIAKPHVSEAVENYQVRVDGGEWRTLEASEWRPAQGGAGVVVALRDPILEPGRAVRVTLRAVSIAGFGLESQDISVSTGMTDVGTVLNDSASLDVDTAMGLSGPARTRGEPDPAQQAIVIIVEVLAALGLVSIGIFIGRRLRRS